MKCPVCNDKELTGKQTVCSGACRVKQSRQKGTLETPTPKVVAQPTDENGYTHAVLSTEGTPGAVRRVAGAEVTWVIPGRCKHGLCLMVKQH